MVGVHIACLEMTVKAKFTLSKNFSADYVGGIFSSRFLSKTLR